jgi:hypothetical protein
MGQLGRRSGGLVAFAIFAGIVGFSAQSQELPKAPEVKAEQKPDSGLKSEPAAETDKQPAPPPSTGVPEVLGNSQDGKCAAHCDNAEKEGTEFWPPLWGYRLKITDTLIAAFTALLFFATLALWWSTRRLVGGADKTAKRQLRAYVFVTDAAIDNFGQNLVPHLTYTYKNTGQTPAYKLTGVSAIIIRRSEDRGPFPKPEDTPTYIIGEHAKFALGPQMFINASPDLAKTPLTVDEAKGIRDGTLTLYFFGEIAYRDIFGEDRFTRFRLIYGNKHIAGRGLGFTADGNETEEESKP